MSAAEKAQKLRSLIRMLTDAADVVIAEWEAEEKALSSESSSLLPSGALFDARRTIIGACGMCTDLVSEPQSRLMEIASKFYVSRALHVAAEARIADILADADPNEGMSIQQISQQVGIQERKLSEWQRLLILRDFTEIAVRVLRCLCTIHVFVEVKSNHFANSHTSRCLVGNNPLRCWLLTNGLDIYTASDKLLAVLFDPVKTHSASPRETAFQEAMGTKLTMWEYFEQGVEQPDGTVRPNRGLEIFTLAMLGGGRVHAPPLYADYPWESIGSGTVVDVGGGVGGMSLDLAKKFPKLRFVVQDRASVVKQAEAVWLRELPEAVKTGRVKFMVHDFFTEQPVKGAEVYLMRYILHDWPDDESVAILKQLCQVMGPNSRVLTADQVIHTTLGSSHLKPAPPPLPANYGYAHQFAHIRDLNMLTLFNGMERTPDDLSILAKRADLEVTKIWECRGMVSITEILKTVADEARG
ncbi:hypothetical protein AcW2_010267 [Taiwanofungus camphoratus]|nr:hypothetical protein AcW2_010267 [Antrodia cinnamomea]